MCGKAQHVALNLLTCSLSLPRAERAEPDESIRAVKKGGKRSEWQRCLNKWRRSELITMEKFQRKESFHFQGKVVSSLKKKKSVCFSVCVRKYEKKL